MTPAIILVEPQLAENIGMVARAMRNFALDDLRLVNPEPEWPNERAKAAAAGADTVLDAARRYRSLGESIRDLNLVYASSARHRDLVKRIITPEQAGLEIRAAQQEGQKIGILFGPERAGLTNDDVALVDAVITVPVNPNFSSLNLAQAVLLIAYEYAKPAQNMPPSMLELGRAAPATKAHLLSFLQRLEIELDDCGFLRTPHMRQAMLHNLQAMFARAGLTDQELRTLHGVVTELVTKRTGI